MSQDRLRAVSFFSLVRRAKRETRKWPRAWLMARDGRGCRPRFARLAASPLPRACIALNLKKKRDCSHSSHKTRVKQKRITNLVELNYLQAEIVIIGPKPHQSTHFLYTIENSPMDFSREAKHRQIFPNSNTSRGEKSIFQIYVTFSMHFPNIDIYILIIDRQCYWFISLVILVNEGDFSRPAPTRFSPLLFMFLWILFLTKYDKIM